MNKNVLIAHTDSDKVFVSLTKMVYGTKWNEATWTVTIDTNPNYDDYGYDDGIMTYKDSGKAWDIFVHAVIEKDVGRVYIDNFDELNCIALAIGNNVVISVNDMYECGYAVNVTRYDDSDYDEYSLVDAMKKFKELAKANNIPSVYVSSYYLDIKNLEEIDNRRAEYLDEEARRDAYTYYEHTGDSSMIERYERTHDDGGEPLDYAGHPWDAPGMKVSDFI